MKRERAKNLDPMGRKNKTKQKIEYLKQKESLKKERMGSTSKETNKKQKKIIPKGINNKGSYRQQKVQAKQTLQETGKNRVGHKESN